jgi:hypothetical protein
LAEELCVTADLDGVAIHCESRGFSGRHGDHVALCPWTEYRASGGRRRVQTGAGGGSRISTRGPAGIEALRALAEIQNSRSNYRWMTLAMVYLGLGQTDSAFAMLDSAIVKRLRHNWTYPGRPYLG